MAEESLPKGTTPGAHILPQENAVSNKVGFSGPVPTDRDKSPEHQYKPTPGDNNNAVGPDAPGGPVNIKVKGGAPESDSTTDPERDRPSGASGDTAATGRGSGDLSRLADE